MPLACCGLVPGAILRLVLRLLLLLVGSFVLTAPSLA